ncbi:tRNA lysidine(34) synthetase TilS [Salinicola halophilus]|uniref:tRNA lysidine(34) synthetase TilS n=1 Tax=Salinicola halophilus TaxID=184065 RepID=UPI000DA1A0B3|nr:tRNA lysidine(34) synthetase TilS [Salinicola halophilus]
MSDALLRSLLDDALAQTAPGRCVWVGLSGGVDSTLMLHLAAPLAAARGVTLRAVHVNHGLQTAAATFEAHCRRCCEALDVSLTVVPMTVVPNGHGIEAAARDARYRAFTDTLGQNDRLWLAQHADDQAETFLLAALRGSGVRGLGGMPMKRQAGGVVIERPWLAVRRETLLAEAERRGVTWCDDPSNDDLDFDRNYLRARVTPALRDRWPGAVEALSRATKQAQEADALLEELAAIDLAAAGGDPARLPLEVLRRLSEARRRLLIRHAARRLALATPPAARLDELIRQCVDAEVDRAPRIVWPGAEARRWREVLYLMRSVESPPAGWSMVWDGTSPLVTPWRCYPWRLEPISGCASPPLTVTLRQGGEVLVQAGRGRRDVKRLLQEADVPPWERRKTPLVWHGESLVAVMGVAAAIDWRFQPADDP